MLSNILYLQVQEALTRSQGNLDEAEQLAARDRLRLREVAVEVEEEEPSHPSDRKVLMVMIQHCKE